MNNSLELLIIIESILSEFYPKNKGLQEIISGSNEQKVTNNPHPITGANPHPNPGANPHPNPNNPNDSKKDERKYEILYTNYATTEVLKSVKSLIEWMGTSINNLFCSKNENPFNSKNDSDSNNSFVRCIKDYKEIKKYYNSPHIILASFDSIDFGLSNLILPDILQNNNYDVFYFTASVKNSLIRKIVKNIKSDLKYIDYIEIRRILDKKEDEVEDKPYIVNQVDNKMDLDNMGMIGVEGDKLNNDNMMINENINNLAMNKNSSILVEEEMNIDLNNEAINDINPKVNFTKKLFSKKSKYPMFSFNDKRIIGDYGQVNITLINKQ